jgi:hypothetical protein
MLSAGDEAGALKVAQDPASVVPRGATTGLAGKAAPAASSSGAGTSPTPERSFSEAFDATKSKSVEDQAIERRRNAVQRGSIRLADQEMGPHGPVFRQFTGDWKGALDRLMAEKTGEAIGALSDD